MPLTADTIFSLLATATFGVYAVSLDQTILFWNQAAERILGYSREDVLGRRGYDVLTPECPHPPSSIRSLMEGRIPSPTQCPMVCASGERKLISVTPMVIVDTEDGAPLMAYLFADGPPLDDSDWSPEPAQEPASAGDTTAVPEAPARSSVPANLPSLTARELQVLRLVSQGWETQKIAERLGISRHTVLNHIRHFRRKLAASTKLEAVVTAIRMGLLPID